MFGRRSHVARSNLYVGCLLVSSSTTSSLRTPGRAYHDFFGPDFVPKGAKTSRFQSSSLPSQRRRIIHDYCFAPLFGSEGVATHPKGSNSYQADSKAQESSHPLDASDSSDSCSVGRIHCCTVGFLMPPREVIARKHALREILEELIAFSFADVDSKSVSSNIASSNINSSISDSTSSSTSNNNNNNIDKNGDSKLTQQDSSGANSEVVFVSPVRVHLGPIVNLTEMMLHKAHTPLSPRMLHNHRGGKLPPPKLPPTSSSIHHSATQQDSNTMTTTTTSMTAFAPTAPISRGSKGGVAARCLVEVFLLDDEIAWEDAKHAGVLLQNDLSSYWGFENMTGNRDMYKKELKENNPNIKMERNNEREEERENGIAMTAVDELEREEKQLLMEELTSLGVTYMELPTADMSGFVFDEVFGVPVDGDEAELAVERWEQQFQGEQKRVA